MFMSRLTKKLKNGTYTSLIPFNNNGSSRAWLFQVGKKLGQLEDIEDELGIDLFTFVKTTTQPILYIKNNPFDNEIKQAFMTMITRNDNLSKDYLIWFERNDKERYLFLLKDYGKTWALTKEELL